MVVGGRRRPRVTHMEHRTRFEVAPTARHGTGCGYGGPVQFGRPLCGSALVFLLWASPVAAQEPGVHVDPNSPAGKEYAIPIDQARRQADGGSSAKGSHGPSGSAALFGAGISARGGRSAGGSSGTRGTGDSAGSSKGGADGSVKSGGAVSQGVKGASARPAVAASTGSGSNATLLTAGLVAAVLLAGALLGLVLHRLNRERTD